MQNIDEIHITIKQIVAVLLVAFVLIIIQSCNEVQQRNRVKTEKNGVTNDYSNK